MISGMHHPKIYNEIDPINEFNRETPLVKTGDASLFVNHGVLELEL